MAIVMGFGRVCIPNCCKEEDRGLGFSSMLFETHVSPASDYEDLPVL